MNPELEKALQQHLATHVDGPVFLSSFLVVIAYVDAEGGTGYELVRDDNAAMHTHLGLISIADLMTREDYEVGRDE